MKRRTFVKGSLTGGAIVAAAGMSTFPAPALSQGIQEWRLTHAYPKNYPIFGTMPNLVADIITKGSGGRIKVKVYGAGEIVPAFEAMNAVGSGTAEMGVGTSYFWKGKVPANQFITGMPFGMTAQEQNAWFQSGGTELAQKAYDQMGTKFFLAGNTGVQMGGWFNREITSPGSYSGLKMRMPGLGGEVLRSIGATIVNLPGGELLPAMQSGAIDAVEWIGPYSDLAFGFHKVAKYYYYPGWHEPSGILDCFVNMKLWRKLPEDTKALIEAATAAGNAFVLNALTARNPAALKTLVNDHKVKLKRFSDETLVKLAEKSGEVINDIASADPLSRELMDSILKFRKDVSGVTSVGEEAYLLARSLDYKFAEPSR